MSIQVAVRSGKRQRAYRTEQIARRDRALSDPIYFIDCKETDAKVSIRVMGTSRKPYNVDVATISQEGKYNTKQRWTCGCVDFQMRQLACKHVQFVWYRVLNIPPDTSTNRTPSDPFFDSIAAVKERLHSHHVGQQYVLSNADFKDMAETSEAAKKEVVVVAQRPYVGEKCPICIDEFTADSLVYFCENKCGNSVHQSCYEACVAFSTRCPYCRTDMHPHGLAIPKKRRRFKY
jgi:hypothetical protein